VNAPPALAAPPADRAPTAMDDDLTLAALFDLCAVEPEPAAADRRTAVTAIREWSRAWTVRATLWGAGPQGSRRAW
jgi:hypothetical protein